MQALHQSARERYQGVELDEERFGRHLQERLGPGDVRDALEELCTDDLFLACACLAGEARALSLFDRALRAATASGLPGTRDEPGVADEVRQLVRQKLLVGQDGPPRLAAYGGRGALVRWLRAVAARTALNLNAARKPETRLEDEDLAAAELASRDPELEFLRARYRQDFRASFQQAVAGLEKKQRAVLRLTFVDGLSAEQVGRIYQAHRVTVARWLGDARATLATETRRHLAARLRLPDAELESVMRLADSQLHVSLARILADEPS